MPRQKGDWVGLIERCYSLDGTEEAWLGGVLEAAVPLLAIPDSPVSIYSFTATPTTFAIQDIAVHGPPEIATFTRATNANASEAEADFLYRGGLKGGSLSETIFQWNPAARAMFLEKTGGMVRDVIGWCSHTGTGAGVMVNVALPQERATTASERRRWMRAGAHVAAALRLRRRLAQARATGDAVLDPDGRVHHAEADATEVSAREALRAAVLAVERARSRAGRASADEAMRDWTGLVDGRWSLIDRFESDGRRFVVAIENAPGAGDPRGLTRREREIAAFLGLGRTTKQIAYVLGLSASSVDNAVAQSVRKLGLAGRAELAAFFSPAGRRMKLAEIAVAGERLLVAAMPRAGAAHVTDLTEAEREILALVMAGSTNADIAARRGVSPLTVATQVSAILRKCGAVSRSALAARLAGED